MVSSVICNDKYLLFDKYNPIYSKCHVSIFGEWITIANMAGIVIFSILCAFCVFCILFFSIFCHCMQSDFYQLQLFLFIYVFVDSIIIIIFELKGK